MAKLLLFVFVALLVGCAGTRVVESPDAPADNGPVSALVVKTARRQAARGITAEEFARFGAEKAREEFAKGYRAVELVNDACFEDDCEARAAARLADLLQPAWQQGFRVRVLATNIRPRYREVWVERKDRRLVEVFQAACRRLWSWLDV